MASSADAADAPRRHHSERRVFDSARPQLALRALRDFDEVLAAQWDGLLRNPAVEECGLTLCDFDEELADEALTAANLPGAIVAGCRRRLLLNRQRALQKVFRSYGGDWRRLTDLVRCSLEFERCEDLTACLQALADDPEVRGDEGGTWWTYSGDGKGRREKYSSRATQQ